MKEAMRQQVGRYRIVSELGRGAMGVVYRATDPAIGRSVAIKTIQIRDLNDAQQQEKLRERLFREARSAGVLSHPHIVTIYDMDEDDGLAYIAMAFVNGPTLEKILASGEPLSGARMLRILRQTAMALDYAHGKEILHRDVKPANIMTDEDGSVKITDFGIAKLATAVQPNPHSETKAIAGTPSYMAPEQVQALALDGRCDQFSLAVIAYEILTGERPFQGEHLSTVVHKIVSEDPPPAHRLNGTLTPGIDDVLRKALAKNPADRFANCSTFVGALELACAESRGWKTLAAGAASELPTMAVEHPMPYAARPTPAMPTASAYEPAALRQAQPRTTSAPRSRLLPVLVGVLAMAGIVAIFINQAGLPDRSREAEDVPAQTASRTAEPQPLPPHQPSEPEPGSPAASADKSASGGPVPDPANGAASSATTGAPGAVLPRDSASSRDTAGTGAREGETAGLRSPFPPTPTPPLHLQDIWVTTVPTGAKVVLDDKPGLSCLSPCQLHGIPGPHKLSFSQPGYLNETRQITLEDAALEVPAVVLRQSTGTLMLTSSPPGASIRINGELLPRFTPAEIPLKPGPYTVTVEKDGVSRTERIDLRESLFYLKIPLR